MDYNGRIIKTAPESCVLIVIGFAAVLISYRTCQIIDIMLSSGE